MKIHPDPLPALLFAGAVVCGAFLWLQPGWMWLSGAGAITLLGFFACRTYRIQILILGLLTGVISGYLHCPVELPATFLDGREYIWTGKAEKVRHSRNSQRCIVDIGKGVRINAVLCAATSEISNGDVIRFQGVAEEPDPYRNLGIPGISSGQLLDGAVSATVVSPPDQFSIVRSTTSGNYLSEISDRISHFIYSSGLDTDAAALLCSAWLGRDDVPPDIRSSFRALGLSHLLCVSGMHVGLVAWLITFLLKPAAYWNPQGRWRYFVIIALVWLYAALTGLQPSAFRAAAMISVFYLVEFFQLHRNMLNTLFLAAAIVLIVNPWWVFAIGFQLSVAAVAGIIVLVPVLNPFAKRHNVWLLRLGNVVMLPIAVSITTFPILMYWFHSLSLVSIPVNIVAALLFPIFMFIGLIAVLLLHAGVSPSIGAVPVEYFSSFIKRLCDTGLTDTATAQGIYIPDFIIISILIVLVSMLSFAYFSREKLRRLAVPVGVLLMVGLTFWPLTPRREIIVHKKGKHTTLMISGQEYPILTSTNKLSSFPFPTARYLGLQGYNPDSVVIMESGNRLGQVTRKANFVIIENFAINLDSIFPIPSTFLLKY